MLLRKLFVPLVPLAVLAATGACGSSNPTTPSSTAPVAEQTQTTKSYKIQLQVGPNAMMLTPDQAKTATSGEVMVQMPGMPMPTMTTTDQGHPVNHHVEAHIFNLATGAVVKDMMPTISITDQASGASRDMTNVMAMYDVAVGQSDFHFGGNVYLADGKYTFVITESGETATFTNMAISVK